jgi:exodeoxyribonuclease VII small subunit
MHIDQETRMAEDISELTYEEAFTQLEQVLQALETGDLPLDQSLALYELGATLAAYCAQKLDEAELRVRQWQPGNQTTPFEAWQEA